MEDTYINTIKNTLDLLGLSEWQHVSVRRKAGHGVEYLGGGNVSKVINRFGDRTIKTSQIIDNILVIYVD